MSGRLSSVHAGQRVLAVTRNPRSKDLGFLLRPPDVARLTSSPSASPCRSPPAAGPRKAAPSAVRASTSSRPSNVDRTRIPWVRWQSRAVLTFLRCGRPPAGPTPFFHDLRCQVPCGEARLSPRCNSLQPFPDRAKDGEPCIRIPNTTPEPDLSPLSMPGARKLAVPRKSLVGIRLSAKTNQPNHD